MYVYVTLLTLGGVWSMALVLWQRIEYYSKTFIFRILLVVLVLVFQFIAQLSSAYYRSGAVHFLLAVCLFSRSLGRCSVHQFSLGLVCAS